MEPRSLRTLKREAGGEEEMTASLFIEGSLHLVLFSSLISSYFPAEGDSVSYQNWG